MSQVFRIWNVQLESIWSYSLQMEQVLATNPFSELAGTIEEKINRYIYTLIFFFTLSFPNKQVSHP